MPFPPHRLHDLIERVRKPDLPVAVIAHRGESQSAPENTLAAVRLAIDAGAHGVEFDVRRTKDDHLVVIHDRDFKRTTGGRGYVARTDLAQMKLLDAGKWFTDEYAGERIPTLDDVLEVCAGNILPVVEIKEGAAARTGRLVVARLAEHDMLDKCLLFVRKLKDGATIRAFEPRVALCSLAKRATTVKKILASDAVDGVAPHWMAARNWIMEAAAERGKWVIPWTVNKRDRMKKFAAWGVHGMISDTPRLLRDLLDEMEVERLRDFLEDPE